MTNEETYIAKYLSHTLTIVTNRKADYVEIDLNNSETICVLRFQYYFDHRTIYFDSPPLGDIRKLARMGPRVPTETPLAIGRRPLSGITDIGCGHRNSSV